MNPHKALHLCVVPVMECRFQDQKNKDPAWIFEP